MISNLLLLVWSNFEIADMEFWRGPAYTAFFEYLDQQGGFYYEVRSGFETTLFIVSLKLFDLILALYSVGEMHLYTPSRPPSLLRATRFNFSTILDTSITRIRIVLKTRMCGRKAGVRVILRRVSVGLDSLFFADAFGVGPSRRC